MTPCPKTWSRETREGTRIVRCGQPAGHIGGHRTCWRCKGEGFIRQPCQACGLWRASNGELVFMVGSVWGEDVPPMTPKPKRRSPFR